MSKNVRMSNYLRESEASVKDKSESWPWGCAGGRVLDQLWQASSSSDSSAGLLWMLDGPPGSMSLVETGRRRQCSKLTKDYQKKMSLPSVFHRVFEPWNLLQTKYCAKTPGCYLIYFSLMYKETLPHLYKLSLFAYLI